MSTITPERIAEMRERPVAWHVPDLLDALESSRAEVEQARIELEDERDRVNVQREDIRTLRAQVQRLRDREKACETMDQAQKVALVRMGQEIATVLGFFDPSPAQIVGEIQRLTEASPRSDAGRVEVPEFTENDVFLVVRYIPGCIDDDIDHRATAERINTWIRSRLSPSPQPATGAVVDLARYTIAQRSTNHDAQTDRGEG